MNIICVIPVRGGSKGIPKKNIINIGGKPLVAWSIEQAQASKYIQNNVYVSSDCDEILEVSKSYNANIIERPKELAEDFSSSEDALIHAVNEVKKNLNSIDIVVFLQATSPLRETFDIDNAIDIFMEDNLDSLFSANIYEGGYLWKKENELLKSFNYDYHNRSRRQDKDIEYVENGSIYIFKPKVLLEEKNRLGGKIGIYKMDEWKIFEIDEPFDVDLIEFIMKKKVL